MLLQTHHKHFLHSPDAFAEYGAKLISYTSQEEPEQRYPQQGIHNAKDPSTLCMWRSVAKTCREESRDRGTRYHFHAMTCDLIVGYNKMTQICICIVSFRRFCI